MRSVSAVFILFLGVLLLELSGCGGGGSSSSPSLPSLPGTPPSGSGPYLTSITPTSAPVGSGAMTLRVQGHNFTASTTVNWNGTPLTTIYLDSGDLNALVPATAVQTIGTATVTVTGETKSGGATFAITINNPRPTITSIDPSSSVPFVGALTVTVTGTGFIPSSEVSWNLDKLATTYANPTTLTVQVPASKLKVAGTYTFSLYNPPPGGGVSGYSYFTVGGASPHNLKIVNQEVNSAVWDPVNLVIWVSAGYLYGGIEELDPMTGTFRYRVYPQGFSRMLAVSANSKYLYATEDVFLNPKVQRFTLPDLIPDVSIPPGNDSTNQPYCIIDLQPAPNADGPIAIAQGKCNQLPPDKSGGLTIYDDGVARPNVQCGWPNCAVFMDAFQWNGDGTQMYIGNNQNFQLDLYTVPVTSSGFGPVSSDHSGALGAMWTNIHYDKVTGYIYDETGHVFDPASGSTVGNFGVKGLMSPDGSLGVAFFLYQTPAQVNTSDYTLESFDIKKFTPIANLTIYGVMGTPERLFRWGSNGLAFPTQGNPGYTSGQVYLYSGSLVSNGSAGPSESPAKNVQPR